MGHATSSPLRLKISWIVSNPSLLRNQTRSSLKSRRSRNGSIHRQTQRLPQPSSFAAALSNIFSFGPVNIPNSFPQFAWPPRGLASPSALPAWMLSSAGNARNSITPTAPGSRSADRDPFFLSFHHRNFTDFEPPRILDRGFLSVIGLAKYDFMNCRALQTRLLYATFDSLPSLRPTHAMWVRRHPQAHRKYRARSPRDL